MVQSKHSIFEIGQSGRNDILSYLITIVLMVVAVVIAQIPLTVFVFQSGQAAEMATTGNLDTANLGISEWLALFLMLLPFAVGLLVLMLLVQLIHKRKAITLLTSSKKINWKKVGFSAFLWLILAIIAEIVTYLITPEIYSWAFEAKRFFPVLIVALLLFPLQTTFEEILFRGYLMQGLGLAFKNAIIPLLVTSTLFGLMHGANPEVQEFGTGLLWYYVGTGLFLGIITLMDDRLELAMGLHAANNLYGAILVTFPSSALQTPALITISKYNVPMAISIWVIMVIIYTLIVRKKYHWTNWKKLIEKIDFS